MTLHRRGVPREQKHREGRNRLLSRLGVILVLVLVPAVALVARDRLDRELVKDGIAVRKAFRQSVSEVRNAVVRVRCDEKTKARGVLVSPLGHVLTKSSEIHDRPVCHLADDRSLPARVVYRDEDLDLAIVKMDGRDFSYVPWLSENESSQPKIGRWVAVAGQAKLPIAVGIVGSVVHNVERHSGMLGVDIVDGPGRPKISRVYPRSGAARAGIEAGDLVLTIHGESVTSRQSLVAQLRARSPGTRVKLEIRREDGTTTIRATLGNRNPVATGNSNTRGFSRRRSGFDSVFEHDAMLKPNECGGVLVDVEGNPIGITIARYSRTGCYAISAKQIALFVEEHLGGAISPR